MPRRPPTTSAVGRLRSLVAAGDLDLPAPGGGRTLDRWLALARLAADEPLDVARLAEAHTDALAILADLGRADLAAPGRTFGVWAAEGPGATVRATPTADGWVLEGTKAFCSGAEALDAALITTVAADGRRLHLLPLDGGGAHPVPGTWAGTALGGSAALDVAVRAVVPEGHAVGGPGAYLGRPGFWHGAIGVAACWYGGAVGVARTLQARAAEGGDPHRLAHLGGAAAALDAGRAALERAARAIDAAPGDAAAAERVARSTRATVEAAATEVLARAARALGARPLAHDAAHARKVADLGLYLRQSHGEADLEALGRLVGRLEP